MSRPDRLSLRKFLAPEFIFGTGARKLVVQYAKNFSLSKVMIATDPGLLAAGWPQELQELLHEAGIATVLFSAITSNPKDHEVMQGAEIFCQEGCSGIIAVGGGSPIDCAKGIGIVTSNRGTILDYIGIDNIPLPSPPLICVPTTASAADLSQFAIITDTKNRIKTSIISRALVPDISLVDPETSRTMPLDVTAQSGMDALSQGIESMVSNANAPITDLLARESIRLIRKHLPRVLKNPGSMDCRVPVMLGSLYSGITFSNASLGLVHAMAHSLGGWLNLSHGDCIALLLAPVVRFNYPAAPREYERIGEAFGLNLAELPEEARKEYFLEELQRFIIACGFQRRLSDVGLHQSDIPLLARSALQDPCIVTNPRSVSPEEVERIYEEAF